MATTDLSLINAALTRGGNEPITSLDDGSIGATIASLNYEFVYTSELDRSRFKLPTKFAQLNLIDEDELGSPPEPWQFGYMLPTDLVKLHVIKVNGVPINYAQGGMLIFCDFGSDTEVVAHYSWRIPENLLGPALAEGIIRRMEAIFLRGIGERYPEGAARDQAAELQLGHARVSDSQAQSPRDPVGSPVLSARGGAVTSRTALGVRRA